jgi:hypothetical protein
MMNEKSRRRKLLIPIASRTLDSIEGNELFSTCEEQSS